MSVQVQEQPRMMEGANYVHATDDDIDSMDHNDNSTEMETFQEPEKKSASSADQSILFSPELLQMYYSRLFPYTFMYQWLSYEDPTLFAHREFSFTLDLGGEEIYIRYQSFSSAEELKQGVLNRRPAKIDIGAVFSHSPSQKNTLPESRFQPVQREFVLDVDLTDYDDIRHCGCAGANICSKCWSFMKMAVKVMDEGLRLDFGFSHIAWFYSGRRGVHAWVCDETARMLTDDARSSVASYFELDLGSDRNKDVRLPYPIHPMLRRAFSTLEPMFIANVLPAHGHGLLAQPERWEALLDTLPDGAEPVRDTLKTEWSGSQGMAKSPEEKWETIKLHLEVFAGRKSGQKKAVKKALTPKQQERVENWIYEVVFRHTYPRLDVNVSKKRNHLLKSPFCVHPKTSRVCVPIQAKGIDDFDPFRVPTLPQLMRELDEYSREHEGEGDQGKRDIPNWRKTSLKNYFDHFVKDFLEPLQKELRRKERDVLEEESALIGDF